MGGYNQDSVGTVIPVSSIALGVWSEKTKSTFIATDVAPRNPALELNEGKIYRADNKRDQLNDKPTGALEKASTLNYSEDSVSYKRMPYRSDFIINPENFRKDLKEEEARLKQQQIGAKVITRNRKLVFESIVANKIFNTSNFNNTGASTAWATIATANPVLDMNTAGGLIKKARSIKPNVVIMGATAYTNYISNAKILNSIKSIEDNLVKRERALDLMRTDNLENLEYFYVADASYNGANIGQTESRSFVWTPTMVWVGYVEQNPDSEEVMGAYSLSMDMYKDSMGQDTPVELREYRNETHQKGVTVLEGMINLDLVIVDANYGQLITVT